MQELVNDFVNKLEIIACCVEDLLSRRLDGVLRSLRSVVRHREETERACQTHGSREGSAAVKTMAVRCVLHQLLLWIRAVPIVGLNSQLYNLNVLKSPLMRRLVCVDAGEEGGSSGVVEACNNDAPRRLSGCADKGSVDNFDTRFSVCRHHDDNGGDDDDDDDNVTLLPVVKAWTLVTVTAVMH